jgi:hypothetical protein
LRVGALTTGSRPGAACSGPRRHGLHVTSNEVNTISAEVLDGSGWHDVPDLLRPPTENNLYRPYVSGGLAAFPGGKTWAA